ncbi:hypothetical protein GCM10009643_21210 [Microbacterium aurantiacum]
MRADVLADLSDGTTETRGKADRGAIRAAREGHLVDDQQLVPARRDEAGFKTLPRSQDKDPGIGFPLAQTVRQGEQGVDMSGCPAAGQKIRRHRIDPTGGTL